MHLNDAIITQWFDLGLLARLAIAAILGLLLGLDREVRGHAAGMRTHGIVCFASAALTVSAIDLYYQLDGQRLDALRLFEAIGGFVGIVGAGLIVFSRGKLHNITTAAHLWLASVIGIGCGAGQWPLVATAAVIGVILLSVLHAFETRFFSGERDLGPESRRSRKP